MTTKELVEELQSKEAVQALWVPPYKNFSVTIEDKTVDTEIQQGACHILIVWD